MELHRNRCDTCRFFIERDKLVYYTDLCRQDGNKQVSKLKKTTFAIDGCGAWMVKRT